jgi:arsenate reductase (thioredoxin)
MAKEKILFLCTGNSARSIFAEYLTRKMCGARFAAYSAGSRPAGRVHPLTLAVLKRDYGIDASGARSKSWEEFKDERFDRVVTVCDGAKQSCPIFPGRPASEHWSTPDPAEAEGSDEEKLRRFAEVARMLHERIAALCRQ